MRNSNITWENGKVEYKERCNILGQKGLVIWFTGLSGAGKSTIAIEVEKRLIEKRIAVYRLDGDNIRHGLNSDLSFSEEDRNENVRRLSEVAALMKDAGLVTLVSAISPYIKMRDFARTRVDKNSFIEVYVKADLDQCIIRDPKGLYKKALSGEIKEFTGITSSYEEPLEPEMTLDTIVMPIEQCTDTVYCAILRRIEKAE